MNSNSTHGARVVLLGASNVTMSLPALVGMTDEILAPPREFFVACGNGRSYGQRSRVMGRSLPGILECGLWPTLKSRPPCKTYALVTDIGNDLLYGTDAKTLGSWIEEVVERLRQQDATLTLTNLPLACIRELGAWKYRIVRSLIFPTRRVSYTRLRDQAEELSDRLTQLAARHSVTLLEPPREWFGFDPIHIQRKVWPKAWASILRPWQQSPLPALTVSRSLIRWSKIRLGRAEEWRYFGIRLGSPQPAVTLGDDSTLRLY